MATLIWESRGDQGSVARTEVRNYWIDFLPSPYSTFDMWRLVVEAIDQTGPIHTRASVNHFYSERSAKALAQEISDRY